MISVWSSVCYSQLKICFRHLLFLIYFILWISLNRPLKQYCSRKFMCVWECEAWSCSTVLFLPFGLHSTLLTDLVSILYWQFICLPCVHPLSRDGLFESTHTLKILSLLTLTCFSLSPQRGRGWWTALRGVQGSSSWSPLARGLQCVRSPSAQRLLSLPVEISAVGSQILPMGEVLAPNLKPGVRCFSVKAQRSISWIVLPLCSTPRKLTWVNVEILSYTVLVIIPFIFDVIFK